MRCRGLHIGGAGILSLLLTASVANAQACDVLKSYQARAESLGAFERQRAHVFINQAVDEGWSQESLEAYFLWAEGKKQKIESLIQEFLSKGGSKGRVDSLRAYLDWASQSYITPEGRERLRISQRDSQVTTEMDIAFSQFNDGRKEVSGSSLRRMKEHVEHALNKGGETFGVTFVVNLMSEGPASIDGPSPYQVVSFREDAPFWVEESRIRPGLRSRGHSFAMVGGQRHHPLNPAIPPYNAAVVSSGLSTLDFVHEVGHFALGNVDAYLPVEEATVPLANPMFEIREFIGLPLTASGRRSPIVAMVPDQILSNFNAISSPTHTAYDPLEVLVFLANVGIRTSETESMVHRLWEGEIPDGFSLRELMFRKGGTEEWPRY